MRPCVLTVSGFGPYADEVVIDFRKFGDHGLYLISGDTGSGKTTIFDAITYALFGLPSGDVREVGGLRSKYANLDTPTFVRLVFELRGEEYTVQRNPDYERRAKKGTGTTRELAASELILPNNKVITKNAEVNAKIREILGLDRNQFSQICMIAQGDFLKLLLAETRQRQEIFRDIFKTRLYDEVSARLKEEYHQTRSEYEKNELALSQYLKDVEAGDFSDAKKLKNNELPLTESIEQLTRLCGEGEVQLANAEEALRKSENLLQSLEEERKACSEWMQIEQNKIKTELAIARANAKKNEIQPGDREEEDLEEEKQNLTSISKAFSYAEDRKKLSVQKAALEKERVGLEKESVLLAENTVKQEKTEILLKQFEDVKAARTLTENRWNEVKQHIRSIRAILETEKEIKAREEEVELQVGKYEDLKAKYSEQEDRLTKMRKLRADNIAGILAKDLKKDEACPVCGSSFHPNPAKFTDVSVSEEDLEHSEQQVSICLKAMNEKSVEVAKLRAVAKEKAEYMHHRIEEIFDVISGQDRLVGELDAAFPQIKERLKDVRGFGDAICFEQLKNASGGGNANQNIRSLLVILGTGLQEVMAKYQEEWNVLTKKENQKVQTELELQKQKEQHRVMTLRKEELQNRIQGLERNVFASEGSLDTRKKELENFFRKARLETDDPDFEIRIKDLKTISEEKIAKIRQKQADFAEISEKLTVLTTTLAELQKQSDKISEKVRFLAADHAKPGDAIEEERLQRYVTKLENEVSELRIRKSECMSRIKTWSSALEINSRILKNIHRNQREQEKTKERLMMLKSLSDTANGSVPGKEKLMLETFVQMKYFEGIIRKANIRFMLMTSGQFELKRKETGANLRSQTGLELDVIDHYNGSVRSVKTLSGGESFKASLSLALGLADEIQERAGGIQLNTMFVDEGFGSLDSDSLNQALKALSDLTVGNRLVGIISHVAELKQRIDRQILVKKDRENRSKVELVC